MQKEWQCKKKIQSDKAIQFNTAHAHGFISVFYFVINVNEY